MRLSSQPVKAQLFNRQVFPLSKLTTDVSADVCGHSHGQTQPATTATQVGPSTTAFSDKIGSTTAQVKLLLVCNQWSACTLKIEAGATVVRTTSTVSLIRITRSTASSRWRLGCSPVEGAARPAVCLYLGGQG